jgi:hypothetical protein
LSFQNEEQRGFNLAQCSSFQNDDGYEIRKAIASCGVRSDRPDCIHEYDPVAESVSKRSVHQFRDRRDHIPYAAFSPFPVSLRPEYDATEF